MTKCIYCIGKKSLRDAMTIIEDRINMPLNTKEGDIVDDAYNAIDDAWAVLNDKCGHENEN